MKVSDAVAKYLAHEGVKVIFGYQGGAITHMIDSFDRAGIAYIQNYNEQGSGLAADAYARISADGLGVAIATNGPGATNLVTAIANAYCDSVPVLFLTGQVHTFAMKKNPLIRQESFQEIDILSITKSITKYAVTVMEKERVVPELAKAIAIAKDGRKGPVHVDIPVDVQGMQIPEELLEECIRHPYCKSEQDDNAQSAKAKEKTLKENVKKAHDMLAKAQRPLIIAGGGIRLDGATEVFRRMVHSQKIPVVASMMGLDALSHDNPYFVGFIGSYGNRYANIAIQNADVILILGSRLDMRQTGKRKDLFAVDAELIHVDIDENELGHFVKEDINIACTVSQFLQAWNLLLEQSEEKQPAIDMAARQTWINRIRTWEQMYPDDEELLVRPECRKCNPNVILKHLGTLLPAHSIVCSDVGQNQLWVAQSVRVSGAQFRMLNSGGLGTMGYSLPAAIGAYYADPEATVVACMGDGGLQMNIQELQLVGSRQLPIAIVVMNNHALGLIRDTHEKYYDKRYVGSVWGFSLPDLKYLCRAYGLQYVKPESLEELTEAVENVTSPKLIELEFTENTYVYPELGGNDAIDHQMPYRD